ncbi:MAG: DMT family transporter [Pseudomonadota bacterium]
MRIDDRVWAELLLLGLIWGGSFVALSVALREMGPLTSAAWRTGLGAAGLWLAAAATRAPLPRSARFWGACLVMGLLNNALPFSLFAWAQQSIESGLTSILNAMTAVFGGLVAGLLLKDERLTARRLVGAGLGVAGVATIMGAEALAELDLRSLAQLAALAATLSYAVASVWARVALGGASPSTAAAGMCTGGFLMMAPLALWREGPPTLAMSAEVWAALLYYGLPATAGAYLLYYRILARAGAANTMLVTLIIPPFGIVLGWALLDERLEPRAYAGLALIALGLAAIDGRPWASLRRALGIDRGPGRRSL